MSVLVTGAAGFIGFHLTLRLLERGDDVLAIDNLNDYYDVGLKHARLDILQTHERFRFDLVDIADSAAMTRIFSASRPRRIVHLAAQPGVRRSVTEPGVYAQSNLVGFLNVLEGARHAAVEHLVYASSSSVYGANARLPFSVHQPVDHPLNLYAATKRANELMAHSYSHLFGLPTTGLRFFTVYGPWGRPDMAPLRFIGGVLRGEPIDIYNHGAMSRDFTFVDDIVEATLRVLGRAAAPQTPRSGDPSRAAAPWRLYNVGGHQTVPLMTFIETVERCAGRAAIKNMLPMQAGDMEASLADVSDLEQDFGFHPSTPLETGLARTVAWYRDYYGV